MSDGARRFVLWLGLLGLAPLLWGGLRALAPFGRYPGPYGDVLLAVAPAQRHVLNIVTAVNFDYRGLDTLGEEFILFASVAGVALLLREGRARESKPGEDAAGEDSSEAEASQVKEGATAPQATDAVRVFGLGAIGLLLLFGLYVVLLGHLSVGGGFQGGVVLATAWLLAYLAGGARVFRRVSPKKGVEAFDAFGAGVYVLVGLSAFLSGAAFLQNVLPLGKMSNLLSAGTIPVINCAVGIEVAAGFVLLLGEFIEEQKPQG